MIPSAPEDVTAAWLSSVLSAGGTPVSVDSVVVTPIGTGQTAATYRVSVTYAERAPGLPDSFVVKLPSQEPLVRERVALGYRSEYQFYTAVASSVRIPLPHCFHCATAEDGAQFVLLIADLAPSVQGDQIAGCSPREALLAVQALAGLHGPRWCDPEWLSFAGTVMPKPDQAGAKGLGDLARMATDTTLAKLGRQLTAADRATLDDATSLVGRWLMLEPNRFSLLHGDYRLDNLLFDPARTVVTVVDWQTLAVGLPARDLAYFTATSLLPASRATVEHDLVEAYHRALLGYGVRDYDLDSCWQDYRLGMLQVPFLTTLGWAFAAETARGDEMTLTMLRRGCQAIRELGTLDLIARAS